VRALLQKGTLLLFDSLKHTMSLCSFDACEQSPLFKTIGEFGLRPLSRYRRLSMSCVSVFSFIIFILVCVAYAGTALRGTTLENTAWTIEYGFINGTLSQTTPSYQQTGYSQEIFGYFGLSMAFFPNLNLTNSTSSSTNSNRHVNSGGISVMYDSCDDDDFNYGSGACADCFLAGHKTATSVGFTIFFSVVLFIMNGIRICYDRVLFKVTAMVFGFMNFVALACALGIWTSDCASQLRMSQSASTSSYHFSPGPGVSCVAAAFVFNILLSIVGVLTSTRVYVPANANAYNPYGDNVEDGGNEFTSINNAGEDRMVNPQFIAHARDPNEIMDLNAAPPVRKGLTLEEGSSMHL
jgi:hypothetical protein